MYLHYLVSARKRLIFSYIDYTHVFLLAQSCLCGQILCVFLAKKFVGNGLLRLKYYISIY